MRLLALLAALFVSASSVTTGGAERAVPAEQAKPMRVMSMNQCTDQIVLALLPPERISSVTWLSRDPSGSLMYQQANKVPINHGLAEEVLQQKPDLVIAGSFTTPATRGLLRRLHYPMIEVGFPETFEDIRATTRQIARAVGEEARGEALIARMDHQIATLSADPGPPLRVAAWDGSGFNASKGSLYDLVLTTVGAHNIINELPESGYARPDVEALLATAPTLLVKGAGVGRRPGLRDNIERHPLVRRFWDGPRTLTIRQAYFNCGTPMVGDAMLALRDELRAAAHTVRQPLPFGPESVH